MILLSIKAGLRACEIAGLGYPAPSMCEMSSRRSAGGDGFRCIRTCGALERLAQTTEPVGPVIRSYRGAHLKPNSVVNWFVALFKDLGFEGCSSHSGRRSFITVAARNIHRSGCSLRDVQLLAGHRSIETTERYIEGDTCAQRKLVGFV
jgi:integrase/recombinase XerD